MLQKLNPEFVIKKLMIIHYDHSGKVVTYDIDYLKFKSVKELMFHLEEMLRYQDVDSDLEDLLIKLSDYNYYFQTNK